MFHLICPIKVPRLHGQTCRSTWTLSVLVWLQTFCPETAVGGKCDLFAELGDWKISQVASGGPLQHQQNTWSLQNFLVHFGNSYAWSQVRNLDFSFKSKRWNEDREILLACFHCAKLKQPMILRLWLEVCAFLPDHEAMLFSLLLFMVVPGMDDSPSDSNLSPAQMVIG